MAAEAYMTTGRHLHMSSERLFHFGKRAYDICHCRQKYCYNRTLTQYKLTATRFFTIAAARREKYDGGGAIQ